ISPTGDRIRQCRNTSRMERGGATREPRHCKIEAAPKKVDWTDLAEKTSAKALKDAIDRNESMKEARHRIAVVWPLKMVVAKGDGIRQLVGTAIEPGRPAKLPDQINEQAVKPGDGHRL